MPVETSTDRATDPRREVEVVEHTWIPMPDGVRLAARSWIPARARTAPVPAIFEYIPYRKADMVRARDERNHPFFAAHGYACVRVDMRGSGDSEGHMPDMYAENELADARAVIDWLAAQPWCTGRVGMLGTSWGGTAGLQASVDAPGALRAVIAVCATHDRFEADIHHKGGCLLTDTFEWGATLPAILALPPSRNAGEDWRERWEVRLGSLAFPLEDWVREEARGAYWLRGSVIHAPERLSRPILAVGGWSDGYSDSVMSLVGARPDLVWGVVGPWGHHYPDHGRPGPAIGFQQLALEWWDHWLRRDAPGELAWPRLRVWLREFDPPADVIETRNGRWIESGPPEESARPREWHLGEGTLREDAGSGGAGTGGAGTGGAGRDVPHDLRLGLASGDTGYFGRHGGLPLDQSGDDARSVCFDSAPLDEDYLLFGEADALLIVSSDTVSCQLSLRLNDVAPDGTSALVALSVRNLHLDDMLDAPDGPPGPSPRSVRIGFPTTAYRFRAGHRIRLAVGSSCWPMVWPSPTAAAIRVEGGRLGLPRLPGLPRDLSRPLPPPVDLPVTRSYDVVATPHLERFSRGLDDGTLVAGWHQPYNALRYRDTSVTFGYETRARHRLHPDDPLSAQSTFDHHIVCERPDGTASVGCRVTAKSTATHYRLEGHLTAAWDGELVSERRWDISIERRYS